MKILFRALASVAPGVLLFSPQIARPNEAPPELEEELSCLTSPESADIADTYRVYVETFSYEVIKDGKMEPNFRDLVLGEGERCAVRFDWDEERANYAKAHLVASLMIAGGWNAIQLQEPDKAKLRKAIEARPPAELELIAGFFAMKESPMGKRIFANWLAEILEEAELELNEETGREFGGIIAGMGMNAIALRKLKESKEELE
ncbi:MAG: hypothetical protein AAGK02_08495 [Pseudomonadota bacterium]